MCLPAWLPTLRCLGGLRLAVVLPGTAPTRGSDLGEDAALPGCLATLLPRELRRRELVQGDGSSRRRTATATAVMGGAASFRGRSGAR